MATSSTSKDSKVVHKRGKSRGLPVAPTPKPKASLGTSSVRDGTCGPGKSREKDGLNMDTQGIAAVGHSISWQEHFNHLFTNRRMKTGSKKPTNTNTTTPKLPGPSLVPVSILVLNWQHRSNGQFSRQPTKTASKKPSIVGPAAPKVSGPSVSVYRLLLYQVFPPQCQLLLYP